MDQSRYAGAVLASRTNVAPASSRFALSPSPRMSVPLTARWTELTGLSASRRRVRSCVSVPTTMDHAAIRSLRVRLLLPLSLVGTVIVIGTIGYHWLWRDVGGTW